MEVIHQPQLGPGYYSIGKVLYYHGAGFGTDDHRVVMKDVCQKLGWEWSHKQSIAYYRYLDEVTDSYKKAYANRTPEQLAEEAYEIRAAFGPDVTVVNIITGERKQT